MIEILIIADDMTGMLDAAAQFANQGISSDAFLGDITIESLKCCKARVVAVTTESRHLTKEQAFKKVFDIAVIAKTAGVKTIFKKTDSVLRGHIGAELTAVMQATDTEHILFFPAYPAQKRTTKAGIQYLSGIPIADSPLGHDKLEPIVSSYIPDILAAETGARIEVISKPDDEAKEPFVSSGQPKALQTIYVYDAESESELYRHIDRASRNNRITAIAGCAGLAKELAKILSGMAADNQVVNPNGRIFAVCGSFNEVTKNQVRYAAAHGFTYFPVNIDDLYDKPDISSYDAQEMADQIRAICRQKQSIVIAPASKHNEVSRIKEDIALSVNIVDRLNSLLIEVMDELDDYTLFHTGGDTLSSFIRLSGCKRLAICGEVFSGITLNKLIFADYETYIISKSGGFGNVEVLVDCIKQNKKGEM